MSVRKSASMLHVNVCMRYVLIPPIVVDLGEHKKESTDDSHRDKNLVSIFIVRRILCLVHLFKIVSIPSSECIS